MKALKVTNLTDPAYWAETDKRSVLATTRHVLPLNHISCKLANQKWESHRSFKVKEDKT